MVSLIDCVCNCHEMIVIIVIIAQMFRFVAAAEVLSMTNAPFEETALKFVTAEDRNGLKTFLEKKLDQLEPMV